MTRTRRQMCGALAVAALTSPLAGCGAPAGDPNGTRLALVAVDPAPDLPVRPDVGIVRESATPEHPPRLRTTLANETDRLVTVGEGRAVHFEYVADVDRGLLLLPAGPDRAYPAEPGCWRLTEAIAVTEEYRTFAIEPGTTSLRHVDLYATPDGDGCLPVGEYRFETTISVLEDGEQSASATWGFSVVLE